MQSVLVLLTRQVLVNLGKVHVENQVRVKHLVVHIKHIFMALNSLNYLLLEHMGIVVEGHYFWLSVNFLSGLLFFLLVQSTKHFLGQFDYSCNH